MKSSPLSVATIPGQRQRYAFPPLRKLLATILYCAQDAKAEMYLGETLVLKSVELISWRWRMCLTLSSACTLLYIACVFAYSRLGGTGLSALFLPAIGIIFVLPAWRLLVPVVSRGERIYLLCLVGMTCYLVKVLGSPLHFIYYDEFLHWRTADDILRTQHLFQSNALLPVSPYYPGLEIITNALSSIAGVDTFVAGLLVVGVARLVLILSLFLLNERLLKSSRVAGIAVLLYMANPHFLLFDAQYGYESLALSFIVLLLVLMEPHQALAQRVKHLQPSHARVLFAKTQRGMLKNNQRMISVSTSLIIVALVFTHHVTDFFFDLFLVVWTIVYITKRLSKPQRAYLIQITLFALCLSLFSTVRTGNPVITYLFTFIGNALQELGHIVSGSGTARQLFVNYTGQPTPLWERIFTILSVLFIMCCLPFGLISIFKRHRPNALVIACCLLALCYPCSQLFRFTEAGSDLTDRAATFLFIPIAMILATCITQFFPVVTLSTARKLFLTGAMTFVFLGGIILGVGPNFALLPGPYQPIADARSLEPEGIEAAQWAASNLEHGKPIAADRINQILMGTYGDQQVATAIKEKIDLSSVFLSPQLGSHETALLRRAHIRYLVVDLRLSRSLPLLGFYYEQSEENAFHHATPISVVALSKFHHLPTIGRIFDSGSIIIYDVESLYHEAAK